MRSISILLLLSVRQLYTLGYEKRFCEEYSLDSSDFAVNSYVECGDLYLCPGDQIDAKSCGEGTKSIGNVYFRLFAVDTQNEVAVNEYIECRSEYGWYAKVITHTVPEDVRCQYYSLHQGCGEPCTGLVSVAISRSDNHPNPVHKPRTTITSSFVNITNTSSATANVVDLGTILVCGRGEVFVYFEGAGRAYYRLFDENMEELTQGEAYLFYRLLSSDACSSVNVVQGCHSNEQCSGITTISFSEEKAHSTSLLILLRIVISCSVGVVLCVGVCVWYYHKRKISGPDVTALSYQQIQLARGTAISTSPSESTEYPCASAVVVSDSTKGTPTDCITVVAYATEGL